MGQVAPRSHLLPLGCIVAVAVAVRTPQKTKTGLCGSAGCHIGDPVAGGHDGEAPDAVVHIAGLDEGISLIRLEVRARPTRDAVGISSGVMLYCPPHRVAPSPRI